MNNRTKGLKQQVIQPRMMDVNELCFYLGLGRNKTLEFAKAAGAMKRIGRRALFDRVIIDKALDELEADKG